MQNGMMTTAKAAEYLGLSVNTLNRWRWDGRGPRYLKLGSAVRYRLSDLDAFIEAAERNHTSAGAV